MKVANGNWIALNDSDDIWFNNKIEIQASVLLKHSEIDFLGAALDKKGLYILFKKINKLHKANVKELCIKSFPQTSTVIFRKSIFDEIGGFDELQRYAEDGNYFLKICARYSCFYLPVQALEYGGGKRGFGVGGLSGNLKGMYEGNIKNIRELRDEGIINNLFFSFLRVFYVLKYYRRIIISKLFV
jgi:hypothetical protein